MPSRRFLAFLLVGGLAALANFGSRLLLGRFIDYAPSIVAAYCIGMLTAFLLNRVFVFADADTRLHHQVFWFVVVNLAAVAQTVAISLLFARWIFPSMGMLFHPETVAHAIGVVVPVITSYLGHKRLTFRSKSGVDVDPG
jgi:putative flippase GtrA